MRYRRRSRPFFPEWSFRSVIPFIKSKTSLKGSFETCGLVGERDDAVVLAFAGTDPGIWQNLTTDFTPLPQTGSDTHEGFGSPRGRPT